MVPLAGPAENVLGEIIVVVLDTVEAIVDTAKDVAKAAVRAAAEIVQRVVESEVFQNIRAGVRTVKDFTDVPETLIRLGSSCSGYGVSR